MPTRHTQMGRPTHEAPTREYTRKHTQTQTNAQRGPARYGAGSRRGTALLMMLALKPVSARAVRRDHGRTRQSRARRRAAAAVNTRAHRWGVHAPARRRTPRRGYQRECVADRQTSRGRWAAYTLAAKRRIRKPTSPRAVLLHRWWGSRGRTSPRARLLYR